MSKEEIYCKHTDHYIKTKRSKQVFDAMEEYSQSQLSEYKEKLKQTFKNVGTEFDLSEVLTLIDKI